jgi:hypothetical protein
LIKGEKHEQDDKGNRNLGFSTGYNALVFGFGSCSKSKNKDTVVASSTAVTPSIVIVGEVGLSYNLAYAPKTLFEKFCHAFSNNAYAAVYEVNKIIAIPFEGGYLGDYCITNRKEATFDVNRAFSLSLEKNMNWLLLLVNTEGTNPDAIFRGYVALDVGTDGLLEIPATTASGTTLDLGVLDPDLKDSTIALSGNTTVTGTDFSMTGSQLLSLAKNDELLKLVKNLFINYDFATGTYYTLRPDYKWSGQYASIDNAFQPVTNYAYVSYQFQFDTNSNALTIDQIGGTNSVTKIPIQLRPPSGASVVSKQIPVITYTYSAPISNYNNANALTKLQKADGTWEVNCRDFFASEMPWGGISYSLGSGNLTGDIPANYWQWVISGTVTGEFDVAVATPITATTKIKGFVPTIKVNTTPTTGVDKRITSIDVE